MLQFWAGIGSSGLSVCKREADIPSQSSCVMVQQRVCGENDHN